MVQEGKTQSHHRISEQTNITHYILALLPDYFLFFMVNTSLPSFFHFNSLFFFFGWAWPAIFLLPYMHIIFPSVCLFFFLLFLSLLHSLWSFVLFWFYDFKLFKCIIKTSNGKNLLKTTTKPTLNEIFANWASEKKKKRKKKQASNKNNNNNNNKRIACGQMPIYSLKPFLCMDCKTIPYLTTGFETYCALRSKMVI